VIAKVGLVLLDADGNEIASQSQGWVCSGFVVDKDGGLLAQPRSLIATANHCLDAPAVGDRQESEYGTIVVSFVDFEIRTQDARVCSLKVERLGDWSIHDVATGVANCDAGPVASMAGRAPSRGEKVFVSGHPLGVFPGLVTEGYAAGWTDDGYLLLSAPAFGGNSGGPVFNSAGEAVGVLVRGSREYPILTLSVPLESLLTRIKESAGW